MEKGCGEGEGEKGLGAARGGGGAAARGTLARAEGMSFLAGGEDSARGIKQTRSVFARVAQSFLVKSRTKGRQKRAKSDAVAANLLRTFDAHADDGLGQAAARPVEFDDFTEEGCDADALVEERWHSHGEAGVRALADETAALEKVGEEQLQRTMRAHYPDFIRLSEAVEEEKGNMAELRRALASVTAALPAVTDEGSRTASQERAASGASAGAPTHAFPPDTPASKMRRTSTSEGPLASPAKQRSRRARNGAPTPAEAWEDTLRKLDIMLGSRQLGAAQRALTSAEAQAAQLAEGLRADDPTSSRAPERELAARRAELFKLRAAACRAPGVPRAELRENVAAVLALGGGAEAVSLMLNAHTLRLHQALAEAASGHVAGGGQRHGLNARCAVISRAAFAAISDATEDCTLPFGDGGGMHASALVKWALSAAKDAASTLDREVFAEAAAVGGFSVVAESYAVVMAHAAVLEKRKGLCLGGPLRTALWPRVLSALDDALAALDASIPSLVIAMRHEALGESDGVSTDALEKALRTISNATRFVPGSDVVAKLAVLLGEICKTYCERLVEAVGEIADANQLPSAASLLRGAGAGTNKVAVATGAELALVNAGVKGCTATIPDALVATGDTAPESAEGDAVRWAVKVHMERLQGQCSEARDLLQQAAREARVRALARAHVLLKAEAYAAADGVVATATPEADDGSADAGASADDGRGAAGGGTDSAECYPSPCLNALATALAEVAAVSTAAPPPAGGRRGTAAYMGDLLAGLMTEIEEDESLWAPFEDGRLTLGARGLQQVSLDVHFLLAVAALHGWDLSKGVRAARKAASRITARALKAHCKTTGANPKLALPSDSAVDAMAKSAAERLVA